ncbi:MAG: hypothetical protein KDB14_24615 [Planctomycetales bacterium]|nr:hypothetical protein [Planctomycetales bacterium]
MDIDRFVLAVAITFSVGFMLKSVAPCFLAGGLSWIYPEAARPVSVALLAVIMWWQWRNPRGTWVKFKPVKWNWKDEDIIDADFETFRLIVSLIAGGICGGWNLPKNATDEQMKGAGVLALIVAVFIFSAFRIILICCGVLACVFLAYKLAPMVIQWCHGSTRDIPAAWYQRQPRGRGLIDLAEEIRKCR